MRKIIPIYYLFFGLLLLFVSPLLLFKKKARHGFKQKVGIIPQAIKEKKAKLTGCLWFHAVSVGEFNAILPLLKEFKRLHPQDELIVSTTTGTGQALAKEKCKDLAEVIYFPYDLPFATKSWLNALAPRLVAICETEIWPGFTMECKKRGITLVVVNGRISPRSFKGYHRWRAFFGAVLREYSVLGVQSEDEARRYRAIAGDKVVIEILGNLKFDGLKVPTQERQDEIKSQLNLIDKGKNLVIVAGSTHEGEESALLQALKKIRSSQLDKTARMIIVPRHPERFEHVAKMVEKEGFKPIRFSRNEGFSSDDKEVYVLDAIGKLFDFYSQADIAFVGGTIAPIGGHNIMEPYAYSVPVVVGVHTEKTRDVADALKAQDALTVVSADNMGEAFIELAQDAALRERKGRAGQSILEASQGAVVKAVHLLETKLAALESVSV